eukprot:6182387-Pleurochrysis_carterae.AAC.2
MHKPFSLTFTHLSLWRRLRPLHPHLHSPLRPLAPPRWDPRLVASTPFSAASTTAAPAAAPVSSVRPLTTDEKDHFVISPEQLASVD